MKDETETIEILDDIEETVPKKTEEPVVINQQNNTDQGITYDNFGVSNQSVTPNNNVSETEKNLAEVKYEPIEPEKQEITIEPEQATDNSKSGLGFVIVIFILLAAFIVALPYITKFLS